MPAVADLLLLVEVSDSTLAFDLKRKIPAYAASGVAEVWLVDVAHEKVIRFQKPGSKGYHKVDEPSGIIAPKLLPSCKVDLAKVFPK